MTAIFAIVKRLLASNKISFILTALVVLCATSSGDVVLSNGNYTWLLAVLTPFFFVFYDFTKLMHLGASKKDYYLGCLISYGILALCISLVNTAVHLVIDPAYSVFTVYSVLIGRGLIDFVRVERASQSRHHRDVVASEVMQECGAVPAACPGGHVAEGRAHRQQVQLA